MVPEFARTALAQRAAEGKTLATLITNAEGQTVWVSAAFTELMGFELKDLAGRKPEEVLYGPNTDPKTASAIDGAFKGKQAIELSVLSYKKDRTPLWIGLENVPLFDVQGEFAGIISFSPLKPEMPVAQSCVNQPYQILVAEDHPINLKLVLALLQSAGCETRCAENGEQALVEFNKADFDLIIMDSQMPVLTGVEAISVIRHRGDWKKQTPIMSLTAHAMRGAEEYHTSAGADVYMSKPIKGNCFVEAVNRLAKQGRMLRLQQSTGPA